jgi:hypothetical protein
LIEATISAFFQYFISISTNSHAHAFSQDLQGSMRRPQTITEVLEGRVSIRIPMWANNLQVHLSVYIVYKHLLQNI